jgi:hypothetical protein
VTYPYRAYGLALESQTAIEGLSLSSPNHEASDSDSIEIVIGRCPAWAEAAQKLGTERIYASPTSSTHAEAAFQLSRLGGGQFFRFSYADGTQFVVDAQTQRIWGASPPPLTQEDLVSYLVGPVLGFVLRRRGVLALHASSFSKGGFAFALCGGSGVGKSTAAAALALRNVSVQSEDIAALRERDAVFWAAPGYPRVNLWPESAADLFGAPTALPKITPNWEKRFLSLDEESGKFENRERQLAAIYILEARTTRDDAPRIETITPREAALLLVQNTYMNYLLGKNQRATELDAIVRLVSRVTMRRLTPHSDPAKIAAMCELLEMDAANVAEALSGTFSSQRHE